MLQWYSLTRRFSVLRNSSGEPIGLDELKSKFAEQRARGSQNQVTEEEEDMILEALGRFHGRSRSRGKQRARGVEDGRGSPAEGEDDDAESVGAEEEELLVPRVAEDEVRPVLRDVLLRPSVWLLAVVLVASEVRYILPGDGRTLT